MFSRSFSKQRRAFGDPVETAKASPRFLPPPPTNLTNLNLPLDLILPGSDAHIEQTGQLIFHMVGDTGGINDGSIIQGAIEERMEEQIVYEQPANQALFFYHLGDVVLLQRPQQRVSAAVLRTLPVLSRADLRHSRQSRRRHPRPLRRSAGYRSLAVRIHAEFLRTRSRASTRPTAKP